MSEFRLIVGLGNPGKDYEYTRHNLGFLVLKYLAKKHQWRWARSLTVKGLVARGVMEGKRTFLLLPMTYMNRSGQAVRQMMRRRKIAPEDILIVCDDLNLDFGQMRVRKKGSGGGHHGLASVIDCLQTNEFARLRLGIGQPKAKEETVDFVLSPFEEKEKKDLDAFIQEAADGCRTWLVEGIEKTMDQFNQRKVNE